MQLLILALVMVGIVHSHWRHNAMSTALARLQADVAEQSAIIDSAATLIAGLADQIRGAVGDDDALNALADSLEANSAKLSTAVASNTPSSGEITNPADTAPIEPAPGETTSGDAGSDTTSGAAGEDTITG